MRGLANRILLKSATISLFHSVIMSIYSGQYTQIYMSNNDQINKRFRF